MNQIPTLSDPEIAAQVRDLSARLAPTDARVNYVATLLKPMLPLADGEGRNAFYAAGRLLGCSPAFAQTIVGAVSRRGSAEAWRDWRAQAPGTLPTFTAPPLPENAVGIVFFASPVSSANVVRIGISTNLVRRLRDLEDETGERFALERWFVGTTLDEAVAQFAAGGRRISGKWFEVGAGGGQIPGFIPRGETQMRELLGADLLKGRAA